MLKERAASALAHGLPVPTLPAARARIPDVERAQSPRSSSERELGLGASLPAPANRRMPLAVKLLAIGLLLLGVIYGLTLLRDHHSEADTAPAPAETDTPREPTAPAIQPAAPPPLATLESVASPATVASSARPPVSAPSSAKPTAPAPAARKTQAAAPNTSATSAPAASSHVQALPVAPSVGAAPAVPIPHNAGDPD